MSDGKIIDIAHISFLDMIKVMISLSGVASAKGNMMRTAVKTAERIAEVNYPSFEDFLQAIELSQNPITQVEGKASHAGNFVFGLKACPFGPSIKNYTDVFQKLPDGYADFTAEFNKPSPMATQYHVGEGAGVSPFCSVHQPMRSAIAEKIKINGKRIQIFQLGCKSGAGKKGFADKWIAESGVAREVVDKVLDSHMCCYCLKVIDS